MSLPRPRMVYNLKEGFESNGLPAGKRDLREPEKNVESEVFKDPLSLVISIVKLIFMIVYAPIMEVIKSLTVQPKSLRGKVCFVTGSGRGLGRGICIALAREGAIIACADINEEANSKTVEILTEMGAKAKAYKLNVADKSQVEALAKRVELELGRVYLLVNNAAIVMPPPEVSEDYVKAVFGVNTFGAIWTIGAFLPKMKELNDGHIVIISSVGAAIGVPVMSSYCASKAALSTYSQAIWLNLVQEGYDNVFLTTVHPWIMNTSADYVDSLKSRIKATEVEDVEKLVINAIKYNKSEVSTHPFLFFLFSISRFIPRGIVIAVSELMNIRGTVPNVKEYKDLYVSDIINESKMGYTERLGYEQNGLPAGKRVLREPGTFVTRNPFKNAQNLVLDILNFIWTVVYISARNFLRMFTAKPKSLRGKVCFVTGSGRGLGRGICIALAKEGAIIACADINEEANRKTVEILTEMGAKAKAYKLNVADKEEVDAIATRVESELGAVYLLVNNAAIVMPSPGVNEGYVRAVFGVNTLGPIWTVAAFLPKMKERHEGHIVNISSMAAAAGPPCLSFYTATKAAISAYGETLRMSLIQSGYDDIHVTTVHPGTINTSQDYTDSFSGRLKVFSEEEVAEFVLNSIKYNKENVSTDPFLFFIGQFLKFLPREILASAVGIMDLQVTFPTEKEYNDLEVGQLVQESNRIGGKKKEKLTS